MGKVISEGGKSLLFSMSPYLCLQCLPHLLCMLLDQLLFDASLGGFILLAQLLFVLCNLTLFLLLKLLFELHIPINAQLIHKSFSFEIKNTCSHVMNCDSFLTLRKQNIGWLKCRAQTCCFCCCSVSAHCWLSVASSWSLASHTDTYSSLVSSNSR